jgi:hypothetical protein
MFKLIFVGAWGCFVAIGVDFLTQRLDTPSDPATVQRPTARVESRRTPELNIPKVKNGAITGYVVAEVGYDIDTAALPSASLPPDPIVVDQTIRYMYDDEATDFSDLKKIDIKKMTDAIKKGVNDRLGAQVVIDVTMQELNLLGKEQIEKPL